MSKIRLKFSKSGPSVFLSHLDLMRTFSRAFNRAGIVMRHSEGFNPHPYLSIAHPLPVGSIGEAELLDSEILQDCTPDLPERLNAALPDSIRVIACYVPEQPIQNIAFAQYELLYFYDGNRPDGAADQLNRFFESPSIPLMKKSKKGLVEFNLAERYERMLFTESGKNDLKADLLLRVVEAPINPRYFAQAIPKPELKPDHSRFIRKRYLDAEKDEFI